MPCSFESKAKMERRGRKIKDGDSVEATKRQLVNMIKEHRRSARPTTDAWKDSFDLTKFEE